jgi:hypothetical protein
MESTSSCRFGGYEYGTNAEVCTDEKCMVCSYGQWKQVDEYLFPANYPERL